MMIAGDWASQVDDQISFRRSKQGFRYFGAVLTLKTSQLLSSNHNKLIKEIKKDLNIWDLLPLWLFGRIESVRMNILPRLLFLLQSLPVLVPPSTFKLLEKRISKCIWQNRRLIIRLKILISTKEKGGLCVPNLKLNYWAAPSGGGMGCQGFRDWIGFYWISLATLPFLSKQSRKKIKMNHVLIKHSLKVWISVKRQLKGAVALSRAMLLVGNIEFLSSMCDNAYKRWAEYNQPAVWWEYI